MINDSLTIKSEDKYPEVYATPGLYVLIIYWLMAIFGAVGNVVTCFVIVQNQKMHTAFNCYLFNLAIADIMVLATLHPLAVNFLHSASTDSGCQIGCVFIYGPVLVMFLTVITLSIERYVAICHNFSLTKYKRSSLARAIKVALSIWLLGFACTLPGCLQLSLVQRKTESSEVWCNTVTHKGNVVIAAVSVASFLLPMLVICTMSIFINIFLKKSSCVSGLEKPVIHSYEWTPKTLMIIVVAQFLCWAPFKTWRILSMYNRFKPLTGTMRNLKYCLFVTGRLMSYSSSVINPIIYNIASKKFREDFQNVLLKYFKTNSANKALRSQIVKDESSERTVCHDINDVSN